MKLTAETRLNEFPPLKKGFYLGYFEDDYNGETHVLFKDYSSKTAFDSYLVVSFDKHGICTNASSHNTSHNKREAWKMFSEITLNCLQSKLDTDKT